MRKRLLYGSAIVLLLLSMTLVVWQGSFDFGERAPAGTSQTLIFWAVSTLVFLLFVTLGFMLFRTGVRLYIERRSNREGSRIRTKLVLGALALSFMPVIFLVLFSVNVLNKNLDKWFSKPAEVQRLNFIEIAETMDRELKQKAALEAEIFASRPEVAQAIESGLAPSLLAGYCTGRKLAGVAILRAENAAPLFSCGPASALVKRRETVTGRAPVTSGGKTLGFVVVAAAVPLDIAEKQRSIESYNHFYGELAVNRRNSKYFYMLYLALITLFVLFVATWLARFLAGQISTPIAAVLHAAREVRSGNLSYRVEVDAIDELAGLVRGFNEMTRELESNSRELDARRRFTEAILESIPTGVISLAADGSIQRVNRALRGILPDAPDVPARLEDLFSRDDTAEIKYLMKRARRTGLASRQMDIRTPRHTLHLAVTLAALEDRLNSGFVLVVEDTSELMRAQQAAAWNEVARRVAHEIKNPLTPIALSAERIARQLDKLNLPPDMARIVREGTAMISREVESVKTLVDELSRFSRFPAAQPVRSDLNEVVESALAVFSGRLEGIQLSTSFAAGLPAVNLDRELFKRVVVNLVDNAAEAMQDSLIREIQIATQSGAAGSLELVIADTGTGVTAEDKEKLFLPYFSTKGRGTGLGLAIVNHILSDHNARIRVEDNQPAGTIFTLEIPALLDAADEARAAEPAAAGA